MRPRLRFFGILTWVVVGCPRVRASSSSARIALSTIIGGEPQAPYSWVCARHHSDYGSHCANLAGYGCLGHSPCIALSIQDAVPWTFPTLSWSNVLQKSTPKLGWLGRRDFAFWTTEQSVFAKWLSAKYSHLAADVSLAALMTE
ncbi:hypothetical protein L207DRAFT_630319 [Hyaloscypha variabilis F]|uniref:Secreted protein n=1 Tax=Hyaloscypha variabilis (strain UAMH 11265 / GT02V1 / F) TaxID=1149755 RepID=A0A2J6RZI4_HYAVF|nr:hypothetical protein L207DRAFT_630319 [Hyaloscypha variabilis F]